MGTVCHEDNRAATLMERHHAEHAHRHNVAVAVGGSCVAVRSAYTRHRLLRYLRCAFEIPKPLRSSSAFWWSGCTVLGSVAPLIGPGVPADVVCPAMMFVGVITMGLALFLIDVPEEESEHVRHKR